MTSKKRRMKTQSERVSYGWYNSATGQLDEWVKRMFRRKDRRAAKQTVFDELVAESQELGLYDDPPTHRKEIS